MSDRPKVYEVPLSLSVTCPTCGALAQAPCVAGVPGRNRVVKWFHSKRTTAAMDFAADSI